jgi:hypothetical protein
MIQWIHWPSTLTGNTAREEQRDNNAMHRTVGPGTSLAPKRGRPRRVPAGPGSRQDHPPVMASVRPQDVACVEIGSRLGEVREDRSGGAGLRLRDSEMASSSFPNGPLPPVKGQREPLTPDSSMHRMHICG